MSSTASYCLVLLPLWLDPVVQATTYSRSGSPGGLPVRSRCTVYGGRASRPETSNLSAAGDLPYGEVPWPAAESGALRLRDRFLGGPEPGEPQRLGLAGGGRLGTEQGEFGRVEGGGQGRGRAARRLPRCRCRGRCQGRNRSGAGRTIATPASARWASEMSSGGRVRPCSPVTCGRPDASLRTRISAGKTVPFALPLPEPLPDGVLGRDPAEQPLPTATRRVPLVQRTLLPAEGVAHDQVAGGEVGPALVEQRPSRPADASERVLRSGKRSTGLVCGSLSKRRSCQPLSTAQTRPPTVSCTSASRTVSVSDVIRTKQSTSVPGAGCGPVEPHVPHPHREHDGSLGACRHDPVAEDLPDVVQQGDPGAGGVVMTPRTCDSRRSRSAR